VFTFESSELSEQGAGPDSVARTTDEPRGGLPRGLGRRHKSGADSGSDAVADSDASTLDTAAACFGPGPPGDSDGSSLDGGTRFEVRTRGLGLRDRTSIKGLA
jgi:hypothetical protein